MEMTATEPAEARGKAELRREMRARRRAATRAERAEASARVCRAVLAREDVRAAAAARRVFAAYVATDEELDTAELLAALREAGAATAVPYWDGRAYGLAEYAPGDALAAGRMGIGEPADVRPVDPADVGVWIVPGLAFTADGARLGYGGGWYDRFLSAAAPDAVALGVAYPFQIVDALPEEPHDRRLDGVVF